MINKEHIPVSADLALQHAIKLNQTQLALFPLGVATESHNSKVGKPRVCYAAARRYYPASLELLLKRDDVEEYIC